MPISQTSILSEIEQGTPIPLRTRAFYRRCLQNRIHRLIRQAFKQQEHKTGLNQKKLADRIGSRPEQVNRWLGISGNCTLNTISDLLLGIGVDLDNPSVTPIRELLREKEQQEAASAKTPELGSFQTLHGLSDMSARSQSRQLGTPVPSGLYTRFGASGTTL